MLSCQHVIATYLEKITFCSKLLFSGGNVIMVNDNQSDNFFGFRVTTLCPCLLP